jgi:hypothetical protein
MLAGSDGDEPYGALITCSDEGLIERCRENDTPPLAVVRPHVPRDETVFTCDGERGRVRTEPAFHFLRRFAAEDAE